MKTELLRSYSSNNLPSLSRTSSRISLALDRPDGSYNFGERGRRKSDINLNVTQETVGHGPEENGCLQKIVSEKTLHRVLPVLCWLPEYSLGKLLADAVAGITIGLTVLPQGLAYAALAGLPAQYGLYSSFVGSIIYIFFGSTKAITIGPTAVLSIMTLSYSAGKPPEYAIMLALLTGIVTLCMGIFRLGFIVNFISAPVNSAFTSAAAITIAVTQIKSLFGLSYHSEDFVTTITGLFQHFPDIRLHDTLLAVVCIVALFLLQYLPSVMSSILKCSAVGRKTVWLVSVARNAIVIVACTAVVMVVGTEQMPVKVVGHLTPGLPEFQIPAMSFSKGGNTTYTFGKMLKDDTSAIIVMPLLAIMEHITISKAFAGTGRVDASQEMISIGVANILGTFFSSMSVTGSFSRTTVNHGSGVESPMGGLFTGIMVLLSLQFLTPYIGNIPKASLGAVIVCSVINMIEFTVPYQIWKTKRMDLLSWTVTFLMSVFVGLEYGILTGTLISIVFLLYYAARPGVRVVKGETRSGREFIMISSDRSLVFPAIDFTRYIITKSGNTWGKGALPVVIDCQNIQYADFTAALGIRDLFKLYNEKGQTLILWKTKPSILRIFTQVLELSKVDFTECSSEAELDSFLSLSAASPGYTDHARRVDLTQFDLKRRTVL